MDNHSTIQESESASTKRKLVRRSAEERVAEIDAKIAAHQEAIEKLQAKKEEILNPKPRLSKAAKMKAILNVAKESGMTPEEIAEKLGIEFE